MELVLKGRIRKDAGDVVVAICELQGKGHHLGSHGATFLDWTPFPKLAESAEVKKWERADPLDYGALAFGDRASRLALRL